MRIVDEGFDQALKHYWARAQRRRRMELGEPAYQSSVLTVKGTNLNLKAGVWKIAIGDF